MPAAKPPSRWTCTSCGRSVPPEVSECHCGTTRRLAEAWVAAEGQRDGRKGLRVSIPDLLGQVAVLGAVFYLGLAWQRPSGMVPPPLGHALLPSPDPTPGSNEARTARPPLASRPYEPERPPALVPSEEAEEAFAPSRPSPAPSLPPVPTPSPKAERSEMDVKREQAQKRFEQVLARLENELRRLDSDALQFEVLCVGGRGEPASCSRALTDLAAGTDSLGRGVQEAEEDARQAWVTPGTVRDLRQRHGLHENAVDDFVARVRRLEARFHGKA